MLHNEKKQFAVTDVTGELTELFHPVALKKGLAFECFADPSTTQLRAEGDVYKLKQVINNLTSNALKFTSYGSVKIYFSHSALKPGQVELKVSVKDSGIGMERRRMDKILEANESFGSGIPISLRLLQLIGGKLTANSESGIGSEFVVTVPFNFIPAEMKDNESLSPGIPSRSKDQMNVLLVDDDEMSRMVISNVLTKNKIPVKTAGDGIEAEKIMQDFVFDLVVTDINMSGMGGAELMKGTREGNSLNKKIPFIAVTSGKSNVPVLETQGFATVLLKPYSEEELMKVVCEHLGLKEATIDLQQKLNDNPHESIKTTLLFNMDQLSRISNGNIDFVHHMLSKFILSATENTEKILSGLLEGDEAIVKHLAHKSIPSFHMLGLTETALQLQGIEKNLRDGLPLSRSSELIMSVHRRTKDIVKDIKQYLDTVAKRTNNSNFNMTE
jgi:CheY-like chemotaxis protein